MGLGWMAITRRVVAMASGVVVGLVVVWDVRRQPLRRWARSLPVFVLAASPFLALQLIQDKGITGHWLKPPIELYVDQEMPGLSAYGTGTSGAEIKITSQLPQK